MIPAVQPALS